MVIYNMFHQFSTACSLDSWYLLQRGQQLLQNTSTMPWFPPDDYEKWRNLNGSSLKGFPHFQEGLPPSLDSELLLDHVSQKWNETQANCSEKVKSRCAFSWLDGFGPQTLNEIRDHFSTILIKPTTWDVVDELGKGLKIKAWVDAT